MITYLLCIDIYVPTVQGLIFMALNIATHGNKITDHNYDIMQAHVSNIWDPILYVQREILMNREIDISLLQ